MSNRTDMLSTVLSRPGLETVGPVAQANGHLPSLRPPVDVDMLETPKQRTRIWDLHHSLHCSIIGTCLTTAELRSILLRLAVQGAEAADDHGIHQLGVRLGCGPRVARSIFKRRSIAATG